MVAISLLSPDGVELVDRQEHQEYSAQWQQIYHLVTSVLDPDPGFFDDPDKDFTNPDPDPSIKKQRDVNDVFDQVLESPDQKDSVESAKYELKKFSTCTVLTVTVIVRGALRRIVDGVGRLARTNK